MHALLNALWTDDSGQDLIEYVALAALIAVVAIATIQIVGSKVNNGYSRVDAELSREPFQTNT